MNNAKKCKQRKFIPFRTESSIQSNTHISPINFAHIGSLVVISIPIRTIQDGIFIKKYNIWQTLYSTCGVVYVVCCRHRIYFILYHFETLFYCVYNSVFRTKGNGKHVRLVVGAKIVCIFLIIYYKNRVKIPLEGKLTEKIQKISRYILKLRKIRKSVWTTVSMQEWVFLRVVHSLHLTKDLSETERIKQKRKKKLIGNEKEKKERSKC